MSFSCLFITTLRKIMWVRVRVSECKQEWKNIILYLTICESHKQDNLVKTKKIIGTLLILMNMLYRIIHILKDLLGSCNFQRSSSLCQVLTNIFWGLIYSERSTVHVKSYEHLFQSGVVKAILLLYWTRGISGDMLLIELTISFLIGRKHTVNL